MNKRRKAYSLMAGVLMAFVLHAQTGINHPIVVQRENVIRDAENLDIFFKLLYLLEKKQVYTVSILHIGDSHIQADLITRQVRIGMQKYFGNAGRGLVFPHKVAGTNGSPTVRSYSNVPWDAGRNVQYAYTARTGIAGFYLNTNTSGAKLVIKTTGADSMDYRFNKVGVIYNNNKEDYALAIGDSAKPFAYFNDKQAQLTPGYVSVKMPRLTDYVVIANDKDNPLQTHTQLYGVVLENQQPGILYNVVGVNGAQYSNYVGAPNFASQTQAISPQLIIISMGTNEAFDTKFDAGRFTKEMDSLITNLQTYNPGAAFILTTPTDCFYKRKYANVRIPKVVDAITNYAHTNGLALWDLYTATGGENSRLLWRKYRLMGGDGVHFTTAGYTLQGQLLLDAIMKAYDQYKTSQKK